LPRVYVWLSPQIYPRHSHSKSLAATICVVGLRISTDTILPVYSTLRLMLFFQVLALIERKGRLQKPLECPVEMYALMMRCWSYKPTDRPTFKQIHTELDSSTNYINVEVKH